MHAKKIIQDNPKHTYAITHHASSDEVLDGPFDHDHIDSTGQVQIRPKQITVPILLGGPGTVPPCKASKNIYIYIYLKWVPPT